MLTLPKLPYAEDALEPYISAATLKLHHGKHHKGYVDTLNKLLVDDPLSGLPLIEIISESQSVPARQTIHNNAGQIWNHNFFWNSIQPGGGGDPTGDIKVLIEHDFGDIDTFRAAFLEAASKHFGSGWIWLVATEGVVGIVTTHDAEMPPLQVRTPLLCCDLWEHAYYLDYQNRRADFVTAFLDNLANWDFANTNLTSAAAKLNEEVPTPLEQTEHSIVLPLS